MRKVAITPKQAKVYGLFNNLAIGSLWRNKSRHVAEVEGIYKVDCKESNYVLWLTGMKGARTCVLAETFFECAEPILPKKQKPRAK